MIVSKSNFAKEAVITATPDSALQEISVVTDGDYSSVYTDALADKVVIEFVFPTNRYLGYIALGGTNISKKDSITITTSDAAEPIHWRTSASEQLVSTDPFDLTVSLAGIVDDTDLGLLESNVMMYKIDANNVRRVTITVRGTGQISIAEIAMGAFYEIPRGEQSGYSRPWTVPNIKSRSSTGLNSSPVNLSYEARSLSCTLSVPNNIMRDFAGWFDFINFAANNTFYVLEDLNKFHSYAGFNALPAMTSANSQTRLLGSSSIRFDAFAKSTEALF